MQLLSLKGAPHSGFLQLTGSFFFCSFSSCRLILGNTAFLIVYPFFWSCSFTWFSFSVKPSACRSYPIFKEMHDEAPGLIMHLFVICPPPKILLTQDDLKIYKMRKMAQCLTPDWLKYQKGWSSSAREHPEAINNTEVAGIGSSSSCLEQKMVGGHHRPTQTFYWVCGAHITVTWILLCSHHVQDFSLRKNEPEGIFWSVVSAAFPRMKCFGAEVKFWGLCVITNI